MKLNILSDIHLENIKAFDLPPDCSDQCLILAGDIGYPKSPEYMHFIQKCSYAFKYVIIITGNHEYYHEYVHEIDNYIEKEIVPKFKNVYFLQNSSITLENVTFWGSTLWSHVPERLYPIVKQYINDFSLINEMSLSLYNDLHTNAIKELKKLFMRQKNNNEKFVVISHHAPLIKRTSHPKYDGQLTNCVFSTDLKDFVQKPIDLWVYGHTHYSADFVHNDVRVVSNALGYPGENKEFKNKIINI